MGACTVVVRSAWGAPGTVAGTLNPTKRVLARVTMSASYATGGDTCDISGSLPSKCYGAAIVGRPTLTDPAYELVPLEGAASAPAVFKIMAINKSSGAQVAATTDLHLEVVDLEFIGY